MINILSKSQEFCSGAKRNEPKAASRRNQKILCDVREVVALAEKLTVGARCFSNKRCAFGEMALIIIERQVVQASCTDEISSRIECKKAV